MTSEWQKQSVGGSITPSSFFVSRSSLLLRSCPSAGGWCVPYRCYCFSLEWARQCHRRAPWASRVRWDIYEHYMSSWYCLMVVLYGKCYLFTLAWLRFSRWRFTGGCWIRSFTSPAVWWKGGSGLDFPNAIRGCCCIVPCRSRHLRSGDNVWEVKKDYEDFICLFRYFMIPFPTDGIN